MIYKKTELLKSLLYLFYKTTPKLDLLVGQSSVERRPYCPHLWGFNNLVGKWWSFIDVP